MNDPEMIEVIVPVPSGENIHIIPCIQAIIANTQRDFRLRIATFGFMKESTIASLNGMIRAECKGPWSLFNSKDEGYNSVIHMCLDASQSEYQIVVPYDVRLQDKSWFGKMQQPLLSVASTSFCAGTQSPTTLPPVRMFKKYSDGPSVFMTTRKSLGAALKGVQYDKLASDYDSRYFDAVLRSGMMSFYIPSMGTYRVEIGRKRRTVESRRS